jgi:microcystin-dependent protein
MDPFVAEIRIVSFNFAPRGWAYCNGQLLPISQNTALFSLLGTTYGGNGTSNFALPDIQGRAVLAPEQGAGLSLRSLGESAGAETVSLLQSEMPQHSHNAMAGITPGLLTSPTNNVFTRPPTGLGYAPATDPTGTAAPLGVAGSGQPHNNMQPYLTMNYIIAMQGVYPPRT